MTDGWPGIAETAIVNARPPAIRHAHSDEVDRPRAELASAVVDAQGAFLSLLSHELKHPLNLIGLNAQLLLSLPEARSAPAVRRAAETIQRTVRSQARVIDDLLDMSRAHAGTLAIHWVPLRLIDTLRPSLTWALQESEAKGIDFVAEGLDESIEIDGDPVRLEQIAWNLLSNAIKFSPPGGSVRFRVTSGESDVRLEVSDTGRGIAPEFLPQVFEMFRQAEAPTTRGEGGLGVGLTLVKSLVEAHGGRIAAASDGPGRGAIFSVSLPRRRAAAGAPEASPDEPRPRLAHTRILLVDDNADTLETFGYLLEHQGATVVAAQGGAPALQRLAEGEFDVLVSDVGMPTMDGYELMQRIRALDLRVPLPAIALTGYGRAEDVRKALDAGFDAHLDKPVDFALLLEVVLALRDRPAAGTGAATPDAT